MTGQCDIGPRRGLGEIAATKALKMNEAVLQRNLRLPFRCHNTPTIVIV